MASSKVPFTAVLAKARIFPSVAVASKISVNIAKEFIKSFGDVILPTSLTTEEVKREEHLAPSVYHATGNKEIKEAAVAIATILAAICASPDDEMPDDLEEKFVGLPQSLIHRWYTSQDELVPELEGAQLRNAFLHEICDYNFVDTDKEQVKKLMKKRRKDRLRRIKNRAIKEKNTPAAASIEDSALFANVFDKIFPTPDNLMLEIAKFCALNFGIQIHTGSSPKATLALMLIKAELSYGDKPFPITANVVSDEVLQSARLEIISVIASRWMLRAETLFQNSTPPIPFPGVPTGATNFGEVLPSCQDLDNFKEPLALLTTFAHELGAYHTPSDTVEDLTHRLFFTLRFRGLSTQAIAAVVDTATDSALNDEVVNADDLLKLCGTLGSFSALQEAPTASIQVGTPSSRLTPFLADETKAHSIAGEEINGHTLAQLLETDGNPWVGLRTLDRNNGPGTVSGVAIAPPEITAQSSPSSTRTPIYYRVTSLTDNSISVIVSAETVYKNHIAWKAEASKLDFATPSHAEALAQVLSGTTHIANSTGHHRSNQVLSVADLNTFGGILGTPIPGAPAPMSGNYNAAQVDSMTARQLAVPVTSRNSSAQVLTHIWLTDASSKLSPEGTLLRPFHEKSPAASTALNMIIERKLDEIRRLRTTFYFNHNEVVALLRCQHGALKMERFQVDESTSTSALNKDGRRPPPFANTQTGLTLYIMAMKRAKSLEIGASLPHMQGWDHLIRVWAAHFSRKASSAPSPQISSTTSRRSSPLSPSSIGRPY